MKTPVKQLASIVYDLDAAVRRWSEQLEIGPWTGYRLGPPRLKDMRYHGAEVEFSFRHAFAWQGELQFELIEPLSGQSIFADHLARHGEGLHHVGTFVDDHDAAVATATAQGFTLLQGARGYGLEGDGAFAYFERRDLPLIVELIQAPKVRIEPEFIYPGPGG